MGFWCSDVFSCSDDVRGGQRRMPLSKCLSELNTG